MEKPKLTKRGTYAKLANQDRAWIRKYAYENGVAAAARHFFKALHLERPLNESTDCGIKRVYLTELTCKQCTEEVDLSSDSLPQKKRGRTVLLGTYLNIAVQEYVHALRRSGEAVNTKVIMVEARGIILSKDRPRLAGFGGHVTLTKDWVKSLMSRMGIVKQKGNDK